MLIQFYYGSRSTALHIMLQNQPAHEKLGILPSNANMLHPGIGVAVK